MVYHTAGAVFSALSIKEALSARAENKALNLSEILNKKGGIGNEEGGRKCSVFNDQFSMIRWRRHLAWVVMLCRCGLIEII